MGDFYMYVCFLSAIFLLTPSSLSNLHTESEVLESFTKPWDWLTWPQNSPLELRGLTYKGRCHVGYGMIHAVSCANLCMNSVSCLTLHQHVPQILANNLQ